MPKKKPQNICHVRDEIRSWDDVDAIREKVCRDLPTAEHTDGNNYCILHKPAKEKDLELFQQTIDRRIAEIAQQIEELEKLPADEQKVENAELLYDFRYVWFPADVSFVNRHFKAPADFSSATFSSAAYFRAATFEEKSQIFFAPTSFQGIADFSRAIIKGFLYFEAREGEFYDGEWLDKEKTKPEKIKRRTSVFENRLDFEHARVEKPERITFNKVRLCPGWFVNVDSRKFVFTDIAWEHHKAGKVDLRNELKSLIRRRFKKPHCYRLLTISCRNLAENAQENNRFEEASNFRKMAFECERLRRINERKQWRKETSENIRNLFRNEVSSGELLPALAQIPNKFWEQIKGARNAPYDFVHFLFRWLSFYSESWFRAFVWLFVIWFVFAFLYLLPFCEFENAEGHLKSLWQSIGYSLNVMTLQRPEPRPLNGWAMTFYGLETVFAPLQAALLALAIRRKFQR